MSDLIVASNQEDAAVLDRVEQHHGLLQGGLALRATAVVEGQVDTMNAARNDLVAWCDEYLLPHLRVERETLFAEALGNTPGRPVAEAMAAEAEVLVGLSEEIRQARTPAQAVAAAYALKVVFDAHVRKSNDQLLPILAESPRVTLARVLEGKNELLGDPTPDAATSASTDCNCGEHDDGDYPELDARAVPHAIRHATVFGALDAVGVGGGMILVAPHDPLPLLAQIEQRDPGAFEISYLERGPEAWRLQFFRR